MLKAYPGESTAKEMLSSMADLAHYPKTLAEAVTTPRVWHMKSQESKMNPGRLIFLTSGVTEPAVPGGTYEAGSHPVLIRRPRSGERPQTLQIVGLLMCVGVIVEAADRNRLINVAAGMHFVTPKMVKNHKLTEPGLEALAGLRNLLPDQQGLQLTLLYATIPGSTNDADAAEACDLIEQHLKIGLRRRFRGAAQRTYTLSADGTGTLD